MVIGFTGTRQGMTPAQRHTLLRVFQRFGISVLHHGGAPGADEQAHEIAQSLDAQIIEHPSTHKQRGVCPLQPGDYRLTAFAPLVRNKYIVNDCARLVATPAQEHPILRSGTWATVRYAMRAKRRAWIVVPDGALIYLTQDTLYQWIWTRKNIEEDACCLSL
jgi:hypothetical protein